jgi:hypothetical protein
MMLNHAPRGGAQYGVMSSDMTDNPADGRAFQATFRIPNRRQQSQTHRKDETGSNLAHFHFPRNLYPKYTRPAQNCSRKTAFLEAAG